MALTLKAAAGMEEDVMVGRGREDLLGLDEDQIWLDIPVILLETESQGKDCSKPVWQFDIQVSQLEDED